MPDLRKVSTTDARATLPELANQVAYGKARFVLTRRGKNLAAVVPLSDLELLNELERILDLEAAREALREAEEHGTISLDDLKKKLAL